MSDALPNGMQPILAARKAGKRPALPVIVALGRRSPGWANPQVVAHSTQRYDWTALIGLDVLVHATPQTPAGPVLADIMRAREVDPDRGEVHLVDCFNERGFRVRWFLRPDVTVEDIVDRGRAALRYEIRLWPWTRLETEEHFRGSH